MNATIEALVHDVVDAFGVDVDGLDIVTAGTRRLLRVAVDSDSGVPVDTMAAISRELSARLDESDPLGQQPYTLEITSRGLDKPLETARHWRRNLDRLVRISLVDGGSLSGRIREVDDTGTTLEVAHSEQRLEFAQVATAHVVPELKTPPPRRTTPTREES